MLQLLFSIALYLLFASLPLPYLTSVGPRRVPTHKWYYTRIRHILTKQSNNYYHLLHTFHLLLYAFYILRFMKIILYQKSSFEVISPTQYDFFFWFFLQVSNGRDIFYSVTFLMLLTFALLMEHCLYFSPVNSITWRKYQDLIVLNCDRYQESTETQANQEQNDHLEKDKIAIRMWKKVQFWARFPFQLNETDQKAFSLKKSRLFKTLSPLVRIQILQVSWILSEAIHVNIVVICKCFKFYKNRIKIVLFLV